MFSASQVSIQWFEAVAVVREVADRLISAASEHAIPELQQIRLSPEGHLDIAGVDPHGRARAAHGATAASPGRERRRSSAAATRHHSGDIAHSLVPLGPRVLGCAWGSLSAPSGRPCCTRWRPESRLRPCPRPPTVALTLDSLAPLPSEKTAKEEKKSPPRSSQSRSRGWGFAIVAAVVLLMVAGGVWFARTRGYGPQNREEVTALADKASEAMGTAIVVRCLESHRNARPGSHRARQGSARARTSSRTGTCAAAAGCCQSDPAEASRRDTGGGSNASDRGIRSGTGTIRSETVALSTGTGRNHRFNGRRRPIARTTRRSTPSTLVQSFHRLACDRSWRVNCLPTSIRLVSVALN